MSEAATPENQPEERRAALAARFRAALFGRLLPIWLERGRDATMGGFHDRLGPDLVPLALPKRLLVQCRMLHVLARAARLAPELWPRGAAESCLDFMIARWLDAQHGGWHFSIAADGTPYDRRKDAYGHAFVLLAMAGCHTAFGIPDALRLAHATADALERLRVPSGGFHDAGAEDWTPFPGPRRQNPHMHLLEAYLALVAADPAEPRWRMAAAEMIGLLEQHFVDRATGTLGEVFDAGWRPAGAEGELVEPGHHFEWSWLLGEAARLLGGAQHPLASGLYAWALRHGPVGAGGGVVDALGRDGAVRRATMRLWPQAEAVRAAASRGDRTTALLLGDFLVRRYLEADAGFVEHLDAAGRPMLRELLGSSPYHLVGAYESLAVTLPGPTGT